MSVLQLILLAIVQGITEFLPISSSAHLILTPQLLGWPEDQGPLIDVMAHFGSLFAVMAYFRREVAEMVMGLGDLVQKRMSKGAVLALNLMITVPPAILLGAFLHFGGFDVMLRHPLIIAATTIIFGIILWLADLKGAQERSVDDVTIGDAVKLGLAQAVALIPGTSRSGITMTAARAMGFTRVESARFSMLMSLPIIGVGGVFALLKLAGAEGPVNLSDGIIVAVLSFISAYAVIAFFMKWVAKIGMFPFMVYRLLLGAGLLYWVISGGAG